MVVQRPSGDDRETSWRDLANVACCRRIGLGHVIAPHFTAFGTSALASAIEVGIVPDSHAVLFGYDMDVKDPRNGPCLPCSIRASDMANSISLFSTLQVIR
jgi:hypothetical protein